MSPTSNLIPDPRDIARLIARLAVGDWPDSESGRVELFERLGFRPHHNDAAPPLQDSEYQFTRFESGLAGDVFASWGARHGRFAITSISGLYAIDAQAGFLRLREELTVALGDPIEALDYNGVWSVAGRTVELLRYDRPVASVDVSVSG